MSGGRRFGSHRPRAALTGLLASHPELSAEGERRVALALIDAACISISADAHADPAEIEYADSLAAALLGTNKAAAAQAVRESLARIADQGADEVRASIAERLRRKPEREVAYLAASGTIYREGHVARREASSLAELARALDLDGEVLDRLSTNERLVLGALYPDHWRLRPISPPGKVNQALEAWAGANGLLHEERAEVVLRTLNLETFQRFTFPQCADVDAILWAAKYTLWLYVFDDVVEHFLASGELDKARAFVAPCLAIPRTRVAEREAHPFVHTFVELTDELRARTTDPDFAVKWEDSHRRYWLLGILGEASTSSMEEEMVGVRHHLRTRPWASGVGIYFDIGEVICEAGLPLEIRDHPEVEAIRYLGSLLGGVFNDLLSYDREKPFDNLANTALALRRHFELDDRGALGYAVALHDDLVGEIDRRIERFASRGDEAFPDYAVMLRQVIHGLAAWQILSRRYRNRHSVVLSDGRHENPPIDPDRLQTLRQIVWPEGS